MRVSVRFFTNLRELIGKREETLEFSNSEKVTIEAVLKRLAELYGKGFAEYVYNKSGKIKGSLQFLINGRTVSTQEDFERALSDGDVLAILPPVGGG